MIFAAATAAGCFFLAGWVGALLWRARAERAAGAELALLRAGLAEAVQQLALERARGGLAETGRQQAELRALVAEAEADELRLALAVYDRTPCAVCGPHVAAHLCPHGAEERQAWLQEHGGGYPVGWGGVGQGPRLPGPGERGWGLRWRDRERRLFEEKKGERKSEESSHRST